MLSTYIIYFVVCNCWQIRIRISSRFVWIFDLSKRRSIEIELSSSIVPSTSSATLRRSQADPSMMNINKALSTAATSSEDMFCLKWSNFQRSVSSEFKKIQEEAELVDITFACEGGMFGAHKLVLFACSPYLKTVLKVRLFAYGIIHIISLILNDDYRFFFSCQNPKNNPCSHPIFFMNGVKQSILKSILDFMYLGEVRINQEDFTDFIRVAELFKIRGVTRDQVRPDVYIYIYNHCGYIYLHYYRISRKIRPPRIWMIFYHMSHNNNNNSPSASTGRPNWRRLVYIRTTPQMWSTPSRRPRSFCSSTIRCKTADRLRPAKSSRRSSRNAKPTNFRMRCVISKANIRQHRTDPVSVSSTRFGFDFVVLLWGANFAKWNDEVKFVHNVDLDTAAVGWTTVSES